MNNKRINRISEEIRKVVSTLIINGLKDPRVSTMTSVTDVEVTGDLEYATIYVSVLGDDKAKDENLKGLESAKGFIRNEIAKQLDLRHAPKPIFKLDESIEHGIYMSKLIDSVTKKDEEKKREDND